MSCTAALLALAGAAGQPATPVTPFCRDYQSVLDQAYRGFRAFRGVIEDDEELGWDNTYKATLSMPGGTCRVNQNEYNYQYICRWSHAEGEDWDGAVAQARTLLAAVAGCSGRRTADTGVTASDGGGLVWRGLVSYRYAERFKVEVSAQRYFSNVRRIMANKIIIVMRVSFRRETRP